MKRSFVDYKEEQPSYKAQPVKRIKMPNGLAIETCNASKKPSNCDVNLPTHHDRVRDEMKNGIDGSPIRPIAEKSNHKRNEMKPSKPIIKRRIRLVLNRMNRKRMNTKRTNRKGPQNRKPALNTNNKSDEIDRAPSSLQPVNKPNPDHCEFRAPTDSSQTGDVVPSAVAIAPPHKMKKKKPCKKCYSIDEYVQKLYNQADYTAQYDETNPNDLFCLCCDDPIGVFEPKNDKLRFSRWEMHKKSKRHKKNLLNNSENIQKVVPHKCENYKPTEDNWA
eukprot:479371_1